MKVILIIMVVLIAVNAEENPCQRFKLNQQVCEEIRCLYDIATGACVKQKGVAVEMTPELEERYPVDCSQFLFNSDQCTMNGCMFVWNNGKCMSKKDHVDEDGVEKQNTQTCSDFDYNKDACDLHDECNFNKQTYQCDLLNQPMSFSEANQQLGEQLAEKQNLQIEKKCSGYKNQTYWCAFFNCVFIQASGDCISKQAIDLKSRLEEQRNQLIEQQRVDDEKQKEEEELAQEEKKRKQEQETKANTPTQEICRGIKSNPLLCVKSGCHSTPKVVPDCDLIDLSQFKKN